jgi:hypothetical protein
VVCAFSAAWWARLVVRRWPRREEADPVAQPRAGAHRGMTMTYPARTVTPRLVAAHARRHESSLRVFRESDDWSAVHRLAIARDPEWLYHESAMDACAKMAARLFSEALDDEQGGCRDRREVRAARRRAVAPPPATSVVAYLDEVVCGGRSAGERQPGRRAGAGRGTLRRMLDALRRGGRLEPSR